MNENLRILIAVILTTLIGFVAVNLLNQPTFQPQDDKVLEQYIGEVEEYGTVDIFIIYYTDVDEIDVEKEIQFFKEEFPYYEILEYEKQVKVKTDRVYEVLIIYARNVQEGDK